jgi:short-subunit dehydrogenase
MTLKDKAVVITGASAGLGRALVRAFAARGCHLGLLARGADGLNGAVRDAQQFGVRAVAIPTDVADADAVERAAQQIEDQIGPIDVWVNNAMCSVFSPTKEMLPEEYKRVTEVTYLGQVYGTLSALRRMLPRDRGHIIEVGSALAYRGIPLQSAYCAAKHAIQGFTDSLRSELIHDKSRVKLSMVQLPAMNTPQFGWVKSRLPNKAQPVPPIYQPEIAAEAIVYVARHYRRELYVGYPTVKAIIGNKIVPWYADEYLARHGYDAQMTAEPEDPDRPDNLWEPVPGDHGAHGRFASRSHRFSLQTWLDTHRELALAGAAAIAGLLFAGATGRRSSSPALAPRR